jgi:hypothetical protein
VAAGAGERAEVYVVILMRMYGCDIVTITAGKRIRGHGEMLLFCPDFSTRRGAEPVACMCVCTLRMPNPIPKTINAMRRASCEPTYSVILCSPSLSQSNRRPEPIQ